MAEKNDDFLSRIKKGEKIKCTICHKGYYIPYNTTADKAHSFNCSNPKCNGHYDFDPIINIE